MHDAIRALLEGEDFLEFTYFKENEDLSPYHKYIRGLCEMLGEKRRPFELYSPGMILLDIIPEDPEPYIVALLLEKLTSGGDDRIVILKILAKVSIPESMDITPILDLLDDYYYKFTAVLALNGTHHEVAEQRVLEILREESFPSIEKIQIFCSTLAAIGSLRSLPVLMATRVDYDDDSIKQYFQDAIQSICRRAGVPEELMDRIESPGFWKLNWQGTPESFAGFIEFISLFMVSGNNKPGDMVNRIAEIFMKEMEVDISPYASFEALRLCASGDNLMEGLQHMQENLECELLLNAITETTGVLPSTETMAKDLYFDLVNDYLMTRLRRYFEFNG